MTVTGDDLLTRHAAYLTQSFGSSALEIGAVSTRGTLDDEDVMVPDTSGQLVLERRLMLTFATAVLPELPAVGTEIRIERTTYQIRDVQRQADGRHVKCWVVPA